MENIFKQRRTSLKNHLREIGLDAAMITSPAGIFYYSGFNSDPHERFMGLVVGADDTFLFVPLLDKEAALQATDIAHLITISDEQSPFEVVRSHLGESLAKIGIEAKALSYDRYCSLTKKFPGLEVQDVQHFVSSQRLKKSAEEITHIKKAIEIIEQVLEEGIKKVKVGITESELAGELEFLMRKFGAEGPSFSTIVLFGERAALPHGQPGDRVLQEGDYILIDMGVINNGYCSDITRTFICGSASKEQRTIYGTVLQSNQAGIAAVKPDAALKTVDAQARNVISELGYGDYFNNRVGHGLGIEVHEEPSVHEKNEELITSGMVFTIEPGIYIPGKGGVRIEDIVYINPENEIEVLTSFPRELRVL
ncbi:M24 family metallopeptidase [Planococcus sp. 1R117A]|uniref:M24 family metallopeptidase n=1 Tax=Planococcus sp. 1R117A TaxID=3447020 RepID=UPI003EDBB590